MGAWIEIISSIGFGLLKIKSHPTMGAWIEIKRIIKFSDAVMSHPTMGAWIEINAYFVKNIGHKVAPHDGCVD